jgi:pimeloyl-ACP methyl ester carboxylesterase
VQRRDVRLQDGLRLSYLAGGDPGASPLVLLHALGQDATSWDAVTAGLAPHFSLFALDLRGHGASDRPGVYSHEAMRDDVVGVLDALDLHDVVLVGHSLGGAVGYLVAMQQPDRVARLVVEDVVPPFPQERPVRDRPATPLPFDWDVVPVILGEANDPARRWWPGLSRITAPTLLIGGGPAGSVPAEELAEVARRIPDCTLVTIPAGHHVHAAEPRAFTDAVLRWLLAPR